MDVQEILFKTILIAFKANRDFFKLIDEFHEKLPPQHKKAKIIQTDLPFTVVDTGPMKLSISTEEIDLFHKRLENFKYQRILFKRKEIKSYSKNIQRLLATSAWEKFGISTVQSLLEEEAFQNSKPYLFGYKTGHIIGF
ncbi:MAG: hypothetical protein ACXVDZ_16975 [Bacteroidia bacterium]